MSKNPITILEQYDPEIAFRDAISKMWKRNISISKIIKLNKKGQFLDILNLHDMYSSIDLQHRTIAIYGMGYVGLTLALKLAENKKVTS